MEKISEHKALSLLELPNGFLFAYCIEELEDQMTVGYQMVSFDTGKISNVSKSIYMLTKFGADYKSFEGMINNYLTCSTVLIEGGKVFVVEKNKHAYLFGNKETPLWSGSLLYNNSSPSDIAVSSGALWASYREENAFIRYNSTTLRQELRIGGINSPIKNPESIFCGGNKIFVSCGDTKEIWKLDTKTFATEKYFEFEESVHSYKFIDKYEVVALDSGIYLI